MEFMLARREVLEKEAARVARLQAIDMVERAKQRGAAIPESELNQNNFDVTRIAYIAARAANDGFESDIYLVPEKADAPLIAIPCSFNTLDATEHYNQIGAGDVGLTHSRSSRVAVNMKTISKLEPTPDAITSALVFWNTSDAPQGLPVRLTYNQIIDIQTEINIAQLRSVAEQNVLVRNPRANAAKLTAS